MHADGHKCNIFQSQQRQQRPKDHAHRRKLDVAQEDCRSQGLAWPLWPRPLGAGTPVLRRRWRNARRGKASTTTNDYQQTTNNDQQQTIKTTDNNKGQTMTIDKQQQATNNKRRRMTNNEKRQTTTANKQRQMTNNKQWQQWKTTNNVHWTQYYEKMSYIDCLNFDFISVWGACFARYGFTKGQYYSKHHLHYCLRIVAKSQLIFDSWKILQSIAEFGQYRGSVAQYW